MKKIILIIFLTLIQLIPLDGFAEYNHVAPEILLKGTITNQTPFPWFFSLKFTAYNQDVIAEGFVFTKTGIFKIEIPQGVSGTFYLSYFSNAQWGQIEKQCEFNISAQSNKTVTLTVADIPGAFISCHLTGNPQNNNLTIHLTSAVPKKLIN